MLLTALTICQMRVPLSIATSDALRTISGNVCWRNYNRTWSSAHVSSAAPEPRDQEPKDARRSEVSAGIHLSNAVRYRLGIGPESHGHCFVPQMGLGILRRVQQKTSAWFRERWRRVVPREEEMPASDPSTATGQPRRKEQYQCAASPACETGARCPARVAACSQASRDSPP